jgi:hypothetical protein
MKLQTLFLLFLTILTFGSCVSSDKEFRIQEDKIPGDFSIISPFFIEQLNDVPLKSISGWNETMINSCGIKGVTVTALGLKNPEDAAEEFIFHFDPKGEISGFEQKKYDNGPDLFTSIEYREKSANVKRHFGKDVQQKVFFTRDKDRFIQVWQRSPEISDSVIIYGTTLRPEIIMFRTAGRISKINFVLREDDPISEIKNTLRNIGVETQDLVFSEKVVTYVDENYRPQRSYEFNDELVQTNRVAEWRYENHRKLIGYTRFINNSPLKEYSFEYSDQKLLKSFVCNRIRHAVKYI